MNLRILNFACQCLRVSNHVLGRTQVVAGATLDQGHETADDAQRAVLERLEEVGAVVCQRRLVQEVRQHLEVDVHRLRAAENENTDHLILGAERHDVLEAVLPRPDLLFVGDAGGHLDARGRLRLARSHHERRIRPQAHLR